jgi:23S rRNA pseudouridine1911/1915/1917 synthase
MTKTMMTTYTVNVTADKAGSRLDRLLADALPELSRTRLQALISEGLVELCGHGPVRDPSARVQPNQAFLVARPPPPPAIAQPQAVPLVIVHEDDDLIVIDKPAGLIVHPGAGNPDGTLVNGLLAHCATLSSIGAPLRPGIVHRLDKDTSGLLVAAKTDAAHLDLARQFAEHSTERAYFALVRGNPRPPSGRISGAVGRCPHDRTRMAVVHRGGKAAITCYRTMRNFGKAATLVECRLLTGRTHQIRVHMASVGHPIVGDQTYGRTWLPRIVSAADDVLAAFPRQALHAHLIGFRHPRSREMLLYTSELPQDFKRVLNFLEVS